MRKIIIIILVLIGIIIALLTFVIGFKKDIKSISNQIENSKGEYRNIYINTLDKDMEELAQKINILYDKNQEINAKAKHAEEELRQSIANMSHDLRTPLTSIMGYLQLIEEGNLSKEEKEYLEIVRKRTKVLQNLITSFYELSKIQEKEYSFKLQSLNLGNILCENLASFYMEFENKNIEPIIEIEDNLPKIISDENAVIRIFSNLINNMLKHGENYIKISLKQKENTIVSEFINSAPNLTEEDIPKLFNRFYIADKSRNSNNTGLGLSITKAFVEELGNEIKAELKEGKLKIEIKWEYRK